MSMKIEYSPSKLQNRLLLSRRDLGWNQDQLEDQSGVSRGYISNIERGHTKNVGIEMIFALANALGVSVGYLLGITDDPLKDLSEEELVPSSSDRFDPLTSEFITIYQQLSDDKKGILLNLARMLRNSDAPRIIGAEE